MEEIFRRSRDQDEESQRNTKQEKLEWMTEKLE